MKLIGDEIRFQNSKLMMIESSNVIHSYHAWWEELKLGWFCRFSILVSHEGSRGGGICEISAYAGWFWTLTKRPRHGGGVSEIFHHARGGKASNTYIRARTCMNKENRCPENVFAPNYLPNENHIEPSILPILRLAFSFSVSQKKILFLIFWVGSGFQWRPLIPKFSLLVRPRLIGTSTFSQSFLFRFLVEMVDAHQVFSTFWFFDIFFGLIFGWNYGEIGRLIVVMEDNKCKNIEEFCPSCC